jgi:hypothetical protein
MMHIEPLTLEAVRHVVANMSPEDAREVAAAGVAALESFTFGMDKSALSGCVVLAGQPVAIWGCVPDTQNAGAAIPWMIATPQFRTRKREAMDLSRGVIDLMQGSFSRLHNVVHAEHIIAQRWLRWLGFTIEVVRVDQNGDFFYFHRSAPCA